MNERDKAAEKDDGLIRDQQKDYKKRLREDFKKNPQKTIDIIKAKTSSFPEFYTYHDTKGVAYFFQNLRDTKKTDLDFVGNYLADNTDVLEEFTKINAIVSNNIIIKKREQGVELLDKEEILKLYLDNYLKTFNFPHDVDKITKLVEAFSSNYYKQQNPNGEKQTLKEIYQKTFDAISENKSLQVADGHRQVKRAVN